MINQRLKQLRKANGISQSQMAAILNKSQNAYSLIESGKSKLDAALIPDICKTFDVTPDSLFGVNNNVATTFDEKSEYVKIIRMLKDELDKKNEMLKLSLQALAEFDKVVEKNKDIISFLNIVRGNLPDQQTLSSPVNEKSPGHQPGTFS